MTSGRTTSIFGQATAAKVRHIRHNSRVALNFNTDVEGGAVSAPIGAAFAR